MHDFILDHDYKKMIRFMRKSLQSFSKEAVQITKPFIDNIDFLIVNFPYFEDIEMISKYFMTENEEFNRVFTSKFHSFSNILFYDPNMNYESDSYDKVSFNKIRLWDGVLGRSGREKLKRSWVRSKSSNKDTEIFTLNDKELVIRLFLDIVNFHYKKIKRIICDHISIKKLLEFLYIDDSLMRNLLDLNPCNIFRGISNASDMLINMEKYDLLEKYYENEHEENDDILNIDRLVYLFLITPVYLEYKTIYNVLINKAKRIPIYQDLILKRGSYLHINELVCSETKYYLYISLININPPEIFFNTPVLINHMIDLWFSDNENAFLICKISKFLDKNMLFSTVLDRIKEAYRNGHSESVKDRPKVDTLFSFCRILLQKDKLMFINYHENEKINEFIDKCYDESFMRYICKLVIDEVPVLNIFEKKQQ